MARLEVRADVSFYVRLGAGPKQELTGKPWSADWFPLAHLVTKGGSRLHAACQGSLANFTANHKDVSLIVNITYVSSG